MESLWVWVWGNGEQFWNFGGRRNTVVERESVGGRETERVRGGGDERDCVFLVSFFFFCGLLN